MDDLRRRIALAERSVVMAGTVVSVDRTAQTAAISVKAGTETQVWPDVPLAGNSLPDIGHNVMVLLGGDAPAILPPTDAVVTGIRGRVDSTVGDNLVANDFE